MPAASVAAFPTDYSVTAARFPLGKWSAPLIGWGGSWTAARITIYRGGSATATPTKISMGELGGAGGGSGIARRPGLGYAALP